MKRAILVFAGLGLALSACSKHTDADNGSAANATLTPDGNLDENVSAANSSDLDTGNSATNTL